MNEGWLCDSILNAQAQPSPMSIMPAFSPGPCTTSLLRVGSRFKCTRDDLYEQCSLHITLKMPSSVRDGSRPSDALIRSYSSGVMPCSLITSGVMAEACVVGMGVLLFSHETQPSTSARETVSLPSFTLKRRGRFTAPSRLQPAQRQKNFEKRRIAK